MTWENKPNIVSDSVEGPFFVIKSPDGSKSMVLGLSNEGVLTIDGVPTIVSDDSGFEENTYNSKSQITTSVTWTDNNKTQKIKEEIVSYASNKVSQLVTKYYDTSGVLKKTITEDIVYSGNNVASIDRSIA